MYFKDLTDYCYSRLLIQKGVKNVGWLDGTHPYTKGKFPAHLLEFLKTIRPQRLMRGWHTCEICGGCRFPNNGEIHIYGEDGIIYCAPAMLVHYIEDHDYLPPDEFIRAVEYQYRRTTDVSNMDK
jgi:hypothetical protein